MLLMNNFRLASMRLAGTLMTFTSAIALGAAMLTTGSAALAEQAKQTEQAPPTGIDVFAAFVRNPAMESAAVSPDGTHIATLQRFENDGKQFVLIYEAADLSKKPVTLGASRMNIVGANWVNNDRLLVRFVQDVDTLEKIGIDTRRAGKLAIVDREGKHWMEIPRNRSDRRSEAAKFFKNFSSGFLFSLLPKDDDHILLQYDDDQNGVFDIFKANVETGAATRIARNTSKINIDYIDDDGDPRLASTFDEGKSALIYLARLKGKKKWIEIGRTVAGLDSQASLFYAIRLAGDASSNQFYVVSNHESDTAGVYLYDLEKREFGELLFRHPKYDATGIRSKLDANKDRQLIGFRYTGKAGDQYLTDDAEAALQAGIDQILPSTRNRIVSRSRDDKTIIVRASGPRAPESWYLLRNNKIDLLGKSLPALTHDMLSEVEWVTYRARDGLKIPALVTVPNGEGPFPVVVNPHGGPVARDYWGYDNWSQILAYHGYLVIQPQFRISEGFGRKHLEAGYGRWGHEMQDDLEDAITYLVKRGLADKQRTAIFGWSYGGYAAFVGAFRDPNPFQCAISGAGVADLPYFRAWLADAGSFLEKTYRPTVDGVNPLDHVDSVDIPLLVIHGDKDERVPVAESHKFVALLKKYNKQHKYIELEGANHFYGTIGPEHYMEMFPAMIDWLDNTCGLKTASR